MTEQAPARPSRFGRDPTAARSGENSAAALLLAFTLLAVVWANSPWAHTYADFWNTHVGLTFGSMHAELTVKHLVNDALMTFFFFIVGLEVKSQFTIGELTDRSRAAVPVLAAIAGLILPAVVFLVLNPSGEDARAWGVVISTDTAFLVGALAIIGPKYPARLRTFLLTLAVVDDVGALIVIAVFYSDEVRVWPLVTAVVLLSAIAAVRLLPRGRGPAYFVLAVGLWLSLFAGGVHPTLAGVAVALLIPVFTPTADGSRKPPRSSGRSGSRRTRSTPGQRLEACATPSRSTSGCRPTSGRTCPTSSCLSSRSPMPVCTWTGTRSPRQCAHR